MIIFYKYERHGNQENRSWKVMKVEPDEQPVVEKWMMYAIKEHTKKFKPAERTGYYYVRRLAKNKARVGRTYPKPKKEMI